MVSLQVAPRDLKGVFTMGCGTCSNEQAFKVAFMAYRVSVYSFRKANFKGQIKATYSDTHKTKKNDLNWASDFPRIN